MATNADTVTVCLFAGLERSARDGRTQYALTVAQAPTVRALRVALGLADGAAGIVLVNGLHAVDDTPLRAGDDVALFPPVGGG